MDDSFSSMWRKKRIPGDVSQVAPPSGPCSVDKQASAVCQEILIRPGSQSGARRALELGADGVGARRIGLCERHALVP
jgi:hypothetical protein